MTIEEGPFRGPQRPTPVPIRPRGQVRRDLIAAGVQLAKNGGPSAVTLREATRLVGVTPNAAYRHFEDRDSLLNEVCIAAMRTLANYIEDELLGTADQSLTERAKKRFIAIGRGYFRFADSESGLFETAFAVPQHLEYVQDARAAGRNKLTAFQLLSLSIDDLEECGILPPERRAGAEYFVWSGVHGFAVLAHNGPLRQLSAPELTQLSEGLIRHMLRGL